MEILPSQGTLMLIHGWGESGRVFDRLVELLPASVAAVAIDLPSHGRTSPSPAGYSVRDLADHLATVLESLNSSAAGRGKAVVLGTSSGGYLAQQLAVDHPKLLAGLVLVGAPISLTGRPPFASDVEALTDPVDAEWVRRSFTWFPRYGPVPAAFIAERVRDGVAIPAQVWRESMEGFYRAAPPLTTGTITTPTLIVSGGNDNVLGAAHRDLLAAIPKSRGVIYKDTGHLVLWERPERVAADVVAFVDALLPV